MKTTATLKREAGAAARLRGHKLGTWARWGFNDNAANSCALCGMGVSVIARPAPNEIDISGEAIALTCTGQKAAAVTGKADILQAVEPLRFDGFGINAADGRRLFTAQRKSREEGGDHVLANEELQRLGPVLAAAPALLALVQKYRAEAIAQGADVEDVAEIDAALHAAGAIGAAETAGPKAEAPHPLWAQEKVAEARAEVVGDFDAALSRYLDACAADYSKGAYDAAPTAAFRATFKLLPGVRFVKVINVRGTGAADDNGGHISRHVHSFIEKATGKIFKAAGFKKPALNFDRGNIFDPASYVNSAKWTGAQ